MSLYIIIMNLDVGSPTTGSAGRMKLSCVVPASVIHI